MNRIMKTMSFSIRESRNPLAIRVVPACTAFLWGALSLPAFGQASFGLVGGITRDSANGKPVAEVQIIAHNVDKGTDRATLTDTDGIFTFTNLEPGPYEVAATKNGFQKSSAHVEVAALRIARVDLPLQLAVDLPRTVAKSSDAPLTDREKQMLERIERLESRLAAMDAASISKDASGTERLGKSPTGNEPLVATLNPVAGVSPTAQSAQTSQAPGPVQTSTPPQSTGGRAGPLATPPTQVAPAEHRLPAALEAPEGTPGVDNFTPFAFGDFTWLNGIRRTKDTVLDTKFFTPEVRFDTHYMEDFNQPSDHTIVGATESFRSGEVQIEQISVGGDFHWQNVRGRILYYGRLVCHHDPAQ